MNNVKTRFIIAVTQRLSAAQDSDAKLDLIEELSENLYSRYQDMVSGGMPENEAFEKAMGELGDVNELLAYLDGTGPDGAWGSQEPKSFANDLLDSVQDIVQGAVHIAREAVDVAADSFRKGQGASFVTDANEFHYTADGDGFRFTAGGDGQGARADGFRFSVDDDSGEVEIPSENLRAVHVGLKDGDVTVRLDGDPQAPVRLTGDTEELELRQGEDGTLFIRQGKTASSRFFFDRLLRSTNIELTLPRRHWERLSIATVSGEVDLQEGLDAGEVNVTTASGDVDIHSGLCAERVGVKTASGDLDIREARCGQLVFQSASGDFDGDGINAGAVRLETMSGDIEISGGLESVRCSTASGDVEVYTGVLPQCMEISSKSGDCEAAIPDGQGFTLQFRTVSGELYSDFPLTGPMGKRSGEAQYLDGGDRVFRMSSVSGDVSLRRQP